MNPTTDSQALLTKTFLNFTFFILFLFFCFLPCHLSLPNSNSTPLFPIPYYYVQLMSNYRSTISTLSIYHSISFIYIMQGSKSHKHSHKAKNPKQKKKHKQFSSAVQPQHKHQISSVTSVHQ